MLDRLTLLSILLVVMVAIEGCSGPLRRDAVPATLQDKAQIQDIPKVRYSPRLASEVEALAVEGVDSYYREKAYAEAQGQSGNLPPAVFLAISGGGDNGAFGAGLLNGWTAAGDRPSFKLVTGVSTGALIAPFAFLGSSYDDKLKEVYTGISQHDVLTQRNIMAVLLDDAMADNRPLWRLIEKYVDQKMLDSIANEYRKGRLLFVGTTNLDSRLPNLWNLSKIAASGHPKALELFRSLMIASAAIPGAFPPVMIDVVANHKHYQEMHVDGGASGQVFLYPPSLNIARLSEEHNVHRERKLYLIRNARLDTDWAQVERRTLKILDRAVSSLIQSQGIGDLYRIYLTAQQDHIDYNLAYIPKSFTHPHKEDFDTAYMRDLFNLGYKLGSKGYPWEKTPPGIKH